MDYSENLKHEILKILDENNKTISDIKFIRYRDRKYNIDTFFRIADRGYNDGYGTKCVLNIQIVGNDWWIERHEYDGSEWWEYKQLPLEPAEEIIPKIDDVFDKFAIVCGDVEIK